MTDHQKNNTWHVRWLVLAGLALMIFTAVFYVARPKHGAVPTMPEVAIDPTQIDFAVKRIRARARTVSFSEYHHMLRDAYQDLNLAEVEGVDGKELMRLRQNFVEKTEIGQTARKERYLLMGDYLAVQFEKVLSDVLKDIGNKGLQPVLASQSANYRKLISISGNFLKEGIRSGLIGTDGQMHDASFVPQILFRKRWRMLGEMPYRYQFLPIESLVDAAYQLRFGNPAHPDSRLRAVQRIHRAVPDFNHLLASALVHYEAKEAERAKAVLARGLQKEPENFDMNQFLLFLTNDTKP